MGGGTYQATGSLSTARHFCAYLYACFVYFLAPDRHKDADTVSGTAIRPPVIRCCHRLKRRLPPGDVKEHDQPILAGYHHQPFLWTFQQLYVNYKDIDSWLTRGAPYLNGNSSQHYLHTSKYWRTSELIRYIKNADVEGGLWGTNAGVISRLTDIPTASLPVQLPGRVADWSAEALAPGTVFA